MELFRCKDKKAMPSNLTEEEKKKFELEQYKIMKTPYKNQSTFIKREDFSKFDNVALNLYQSDYVVLDFDTPQDTQAFLNVANYLKLNYWKQTTKKGIHAMFKLGNDAYKNFAPAITPLTIKCDVRSGNNKGYICVKVDGQPRMWEHSINNTNSYTAEEMLERLDESVVDEIPKVLQPLVKGNDKSSGSGLVDGDGRNSVLAEAYGRMIYLGYEPDYARECLDMINEFVFKEPTLESKLDDVVRGVSTEKFDGGTDLVKKNKANTQNSASDKGAYEVATAKKIIELYSIFRESSGAVYFFDEKAQLYKPLDKEILRYLTIDYDVAISQSSRSNIMTNVYALLYAVPTRERDKFKIKFRNGIYDFKTKEFMSNDRSKDFFIANSIPWDYKEQPDDEEKVRNYIVSLFDTVETEEMYLFITQMIAYFMLPINGYKDINQFFIAYGGGRNGKSEFNALVKRVIGGENFSSLRLEQLNDRFSPFNMLNKLLNINDELDGGATLKTSMLKSITSGDIITLEKKGEQPINVELYCKMYFSTNDIPFFADTSFGFKRRLKIIPFNKTFDKDNGVDLSYLREKDFIEDLISIAIRNSVKLLETKQFQKVNLVDDFTNAINKTHDPFNDFLKQLPRMMKQNDETPFTIETLEEDGWMPKYEPGIVFKHMYEYYQQYQYASGLKPMSAGQFEKNLFTQGFEIIHEYERNDNIYKVVLLNKKEK